VGSGLTGGGSAFFSASPHSDAGDAVLMSRDDYEALTETAWLLRVPANAQRLLVSLAQARSGQRETHDLA
jgi:antitoxin YefM